MHYQTVDGREILDGTGGLWCCNAGHARTAHRRGGAASRSRPWISPPLSRWATRCPSCWPSAWPRSRRATLNHVFFTNSGSESVDTALKIAIAYHRARGEGQRTRLIGREKGYHGVGFGGISVGGLLNNRKFFGTDAARRGSPAPHPGHRPQCVLQGPAANTASNWPKTWNAWSRCMTRRTIAAVIIEPISGSAGVVLPPEGYLKRIRELCNKHGILLIFDEVITGFGRVGNAFAAQRFDVTPGHDHHCQGPHQRLRADGRGVRVRPGP